MRKFFSGGMEDANGEGHSWEAIRGELQQIIDNEDKSKPLSDDQIRKKLAEAGKAGFVGDRHVRRAMCAGLLRELLHGGTGHEPGHAESVGEGGEDLEGRLSHRAGGSQYDDVAHGR